jgi:hypothetical protein
MAVAVRLAWLGGELEVNDCVSRRKGGTVKQGGKASFEAEELQ